MTPLWRLSAAARHLDARAPTVVPTLARVVFAGVLLHYYLNSALTKIGPGPFTPSDGAYIQIFPRTVAAAGYDLSQLGLLHRLVVLAGTWAEILLPVLIVAGLATRLAALGMIGFVVVQSVVDVTGHGVETGAWFDGAASALILDQRAFWVFLLATLVAMGAGPLSLDRAVGRRFGRRIGPAGGRYGPGAGRADGPQPG